MSKLPPAAQRNAWMLYQAGFSTGFIADRIWQRYGFKNMQSCQAALFRHWRGRPLRNKAEAAKARRLGGHCVGCGCLYDERTQGCGTCIRRFNNTNRIGTVPAPSRVECSGCGCSLDERTFACKQCITRHSLRRRRAKRAAALSLGGTTFQKEAA